MRFHDFIGKVQNLADLPGEQDALKTTRVTLETLAERLAGNEPNNIAAQLPEEIGRFLTTEQTEGESFSLEDFYRRVAEKTGADETDARHQARAVMAVVNEAITSGEMRDIRSQLPNEFNSLLYPPENESNR